MFTGIIRDIGEVASVHKEDDWRLKIKTNLDLNNFDMGASIACSGVCLTLIEKGDDWFGVDVSRETLDCTNMRNLEAGDKLNIEPSLCLGDPIDGHLVYGHVDGVARLACLYKEDGSHRLEFDAPIDLAPFIAPKGSVALEGISLTVNDVHGCGFGINIIPHTWKVTNFHNLKVGDMVNLEVDRMARYLARFQEQAA